MTVGCPVLGVTGLVGKAFTPRRTEMIRPRVEELTSELLGRLAAAVPGEVADLPVRLTAAVHA